MRASNEWKEPGEGRPEPGAQAPGGARGQPQASEVNKIREAAVREVREETGIWACIRDKLECVSFFVDGKPISVQFYLMEAVARGCPSELREHVWMPLDNAVYNASHPETQSLLMSVRKIPDPLVTRSILRRFRQCVFPTKQQHHRQR